MSGQIEVRSRNIINSKLHQEIEDVITELLIVSRADWARTAHRQAFVESVEDFLDDLINQGLITHQKVMCDTRNNPDGFANSQTIVFEAFYKYPQSLTFSAVVILIPNTQNGR